jgi:hypothetical protein
MLDCVRCLTTCGTLRCEVVSTGNGCCMSAGKMKKLYTGFLMLGNCEMFKIRNTVYLAGKMKMST